MIPKKIHYCWFGRNELPPLAKKCIASWKKYCPDYEIIEWNEDNFDVSLNAYTRYCYENKKWAFLSDFVRLQVIHDHGGIYFDTDVEVVSSFDSLLMYDAFYCFENDSYLATGLGFASVAHHPSVATMLKMYLVGTLISSPKLKSKLGNKMNEGMLMPYNKLLKEVVVKRVK